MDNGQIVSDMTMQEFRQKSESELHVMGLRSKPRVLFSKSDVVSNAGAIVFEHFSYVYKKSRGVKALDIEQLEIPMGAVVGILGDNGVSKSTVGQCLCGLEEAEREGFSIKGVGFLPKSGFDSAIWVCRM